MFVEINQLCHLQIEVYGYPVETKCQLDWYSSIHYSFNFIIIQQYGLTLLGTASLTAFSKKYDPNKPPDHNAHLLVHDA